MTNNQKVVMTYPQPNLIPPTTNVCRNLADRTRSFTFGYLSMPRGLISHEVVPHPLRPSLIRAYRRLATRSRPHPRLARGPSYAVHELAGSALARGGALCDAAPFEHIQRAA